MTDGRLIDHLTSARWFGGNRRTARLLGLIPLPWLQPLGSWPAVRLEIARIGYPDSEDEDLYQLLISYHPDHRPEDALVVLEDADHGRLAGVDGTEDPAAHRALLAAIIDAVPAHDQDSRPGVGPALRSQLLDRTGLLATLPSRLYGGEQSNTSIEYAHRAILKLFRHLHPGRNRDIETLAALTRAGSREVPALCGWLEGRWPDPSGRQAVVVDLLMLTSYVPNSRDGWELALAEFRLAAGRPDPTGDHDFTAEAADLGRVLSRVHSTLRQEFSTAEVAGDQLADQMQQRLAAAVRQVPELAEHAAGLEALFERLHGRQLNVQRVHGDFHLGQALRTPNGWMIIDFEGEPATPVADRARPDSCWRDIAGVLRSFDYVAAQGTAPDRPDRTATSWAIDCGRAFLAGYGEDVDNSSNADLLRAYLADKAIYETVYESRHRPQWLPIPLAAVAELAG
ncbi:MAG TPA: phosphotransferase [Microlunatus sp.]